jgi:hypothetical protein
MSGRSNACSELVRFWLRAIGKIVVSLTTLPD